MQTNTAPAHNEIHATRTRSLAKAVSWRIVATTVTWIVVFTFTGEVAETTVIAAVSAGVLIGIYYIHERIWDRVR